MSIHEESTVFAQRPMMGAFNNLVMFDQHATQASLQSSVPDLATSWSWNEDGTELTFPLRQGIKWHDGKPFTAADVKCTWDTLAGTQGERLRINPRKSWYRNLEAVTTNGDFEVTFHLKRPQPVRLQKVRAHLQSQNALRRGFSFHAGTTRRRQGQTTVGWPAAIPTAANDRVGPDCSLPKHGVRDRPVARPPARSGLQPIRPPAPNATRHPAALASRKP
jgi:Bacterial extracellular solute-binding proteins, family 5 Middle